MSNENATYANMPNTMLGSLRSRPPPASPPLVQAPPPPRSLPRSPRPLSRASGRPPIYPSSAGHHHPTPPHYTYRHNSRSYLRSPGALSSAGAPTPTPLDDELLNQLSRDELMERLKIIEARNRKLTFDNGTIMKDINTHITQLQQLKRQKFLLVSDNNELRDLCCYLDDERAKSRTVAREWQGFGTHMSKVMRQEVTAYTTKLTDLENKQFELVRQNFELKQLCLLLDNAISVRENGDGSTGSNSEDPMDENQNTSQNGPRTQRPAISQQTLEYIRSLEDRIQYLERERGGSIRSPQPPMSQSHHQRHSDLNSNADTLDSFESNSQATSSDQNTLTKSAQSAVRCPPALAEAMRFLRIHDSIKDEAKKNGLNPGTVNRPVIRQPERKSSTGVIRSRRNSTEHNLEEMSLDEQRALMRQLCGGNWKKNEDIV